MNYIVTIAQYMTIELIFGIVMGVLSMEIIKLNTRNSSTMQLFSSSEYYSIGYGNNLPKLDFFNIFNLKSKLVVVHYREEQVVREDFYTFFGDRITAIYQDGIFTSSYWELWGLPIYICTAVAPSFTGFFLGILLSFSPLLESFFTYLFISGFIWGMVGGFLPYVLYREVE